MVFNITKKEREKKSVLKNKAETIYMALEARYRLSPKVKKKK